MELELNYVKNEGDVQKFAENYYAFSLNARKTKKWYFVLAIIVALIITYPIHKSFEDGAIPYLLMFIIILIPSSIYMVNNHKKHIIESINKRHTSKDLGILGEHKAFLSDDEIRITYLPNDTKRQRNMTNKWDDFDFYNRDGDHFFLYINKSDLIYHIKAGEKAAEDVDQFLQRQGLMKQERNQK
ncbi:hypothetical protein KFZ56_17190 [Virgibacillus sp. NKC19-3]|uniref:hypothetical protein n=1 Tax=Virgibacillus saliphilus TaxID=2831674 RepID=UPI001C9B11B2|nr:hypothetical protein [Virgibacillus sp. NKC19-3]MBY7144757.1 hypothetical protein [Virgibacillus sp. NKC19-3]